MSIPLPREHEDAFVVPEKAPAPPPAPQVETWSPTGTPGIEINQDGLRRTNIPPKRIWISSRRLL